MLLDNFRLDTLCSVIKESGYPNGKNVKKLNVFLLKLFVVIIFCSSYSLDSIPSMKVKKIKRFPCTLSVL